MNDSSDQNRLTDDHDELLMLLAGEVLGGLDDDEKERLRELEGSTMHLSETRESLGRVANSIELAADLIGNESLSNAEGIPMSLDPELVSKIREQAVKHLAETPDGGPSLASADVSPKSRNIPPNGGVITSPWIGWCVAAGLAFLCVGMWWTQQPNAGSPTIARVTGEGEAEAWIRSHPDAIQIDWSIKDSTIVVDAEGEAGRLAWDSQSQTGFMSFSALPINDTSIQQYQLWIIDPERDDKPIDGGVFDIVRSGESFVPIQAKLKVIDPIGFAITVEKPGGVVVSDQSRLPLLAMVP